MNALTPPAEAAEIFGSDEACATAIARIGALDRLLARIEADKSAAVAAAGTAAETAAKPFGEERAALVPQIEAYCVAHRDRLTDGGKTKTAKFTTGAVAWKKQPDKVIVDETMLDKILEKLKATGLKRLIRIVESVDRRAIMADFRRGRKPPKIRGLSIEKGAEDFSVTPIESPLVNASP